jgi:hypothetical protein
LSGPAEEQTFVDLPPYVARPLAVYVNGVEQDPGVDYQLVGGTLVFPRALVPEVKMSRIEWALVTVGIGKYRKHDSVDVIYEHEGRRLVAAGLPLRSADA